MADPKIDLPQVTPGDLVSLTCPEGSTVTFTVGDVISRDEKGQATAKVVRIEGNTFWVGPLKAGDFHLQYDCAGHAEKLTSHFRLVPLKPEELPEAAPPLAPLLFAYPLWLWLALAAAGATLLLAGWALYRRLARRLAPPPRKIEARKIPPDEAFELFLREVEKSHLVDKDDESSVQHLYGQGYERLRKFLEYHYELKTLIETTREFLGSLRAAAPRLGLTASSLDAIDDLLTNADRVRFAKDIPAPEARKFFVKRLGELGAALRVQKNQVPPPPAKGFR